MSESYKVYASQEYVDSKLNDVSGLPSGSKPNQYIVTDGDGNAKWEDKLAWSESSEEVILPECQLTSQENMDGMEVFATENGCLVTVGETYIVNWSGTDYLVTAKDNGNGDGIGMGNWSAMGQYDTGEPFFVASSYNQSGFEILALDGSTTLTISIRRVTETVHPIDKKYLPDTVVDKDYVDDEVAALVNSAPETLDTLGELAEAFQENKEVVDVLNEAIATKYSSSNPPPYPVTSVQGKTGAVNFTTETWTFTLSNGSTVTKKVLLG